MKHIESILLGIKSNVVKIELILIDDQVNNITVWRHTHSKFLSTTLKQPIIDVR